MITRTRLVAMAASGIGLLALGTGCQTGEPEGEGLMFFPAPPGKPRVQFLTWASGAEQVEPGSSQFEEFILGEEPEAARAINKPYGVAARDGVVYVCDTKGLCLSRMDFKTHTYSVMGGRGPERLRKPINLVIDPLGFKFVVDPVRKQIVVFSPDDEYVTAYDVPQPCRPVDVAIFENELYVLDNDADCQVVVLDRTSGEVLRTFGGPGGEPGQFKIPGSLCTDEDGFVYVSDTHNWRIQKLTREGEPIWAKGSPGYHLGQFGRPRGIRVGPDGVVYVADGSTEIVQMFNTDGETLMRFGGPGDMPGALGLPSSLAIDASSLPYFSKYVHKDFKAEYLMFVVSQYGKRLINVYAFGSFPDGYQVSKLKVAPLPKIKMDEGIGAVEEQEDLSQDPMHSEQPSDAQDPE